MLKTNKYCKRTMSDSVKKTLPNLIKEVIFFYVKYYYDKYLKDNNLTLLTDEQIIVFVDKHYTNKEKEIRDYVRKSLKKNLGDDYNSLATENILLEIFSDANMAKERLKLEISDYQTNHT
jgi:hypothetical protein